MRAMFAIPLLLSQFLPALASHAAINDVMPGNYFSLQPGVAVLPWSDSRVSPAPLATALGEKAKGLSDLRLGLTAWHAHVGGQVNRGGETRINGVGQRNPANNERVMAGMSWFLPDKQQIILHFARDTAIDNGFRTGREILLRYQKGF
jgi:hypothetical protein